MPLLFYLIISDVHVTRARSNSQDVTLVLRLFSFMCSKWDGSSRSCKYFLRYLLPDITALKCSFQKAFVTLPIQVHLLIYKTTWIWTTQLIHKMFLLRVDGLENDYLTAVFDSRHHFPRFVWSVVGIAMVGLGVFCFVELVTDFLQYPSYTEISSQSAEEYYLPAITICNMNLLNKTKMQETKTGKGPQSQTVYDLYREFAGIVGNRGAGQDRKNVDYDALNNLNLYKDFRWDILETVDHGSFTFAKEQLGNVRGSGLVNTKYTEMGNCLEINDNQALVQRVNGPMGGLSIIIDTKTDDYLETTESEGFLVLIRMPNETVLNKEYAFAVTPGRTTYVELRTTQVTR